MSNACTTRRCYARITAHGSTWDFGCLAPASRPSRTLMPVASVLGPEPDDAAITHPPRSFKVRLQVPKMGLLCRLKSNVVGASWVRERVTGVPRIYFYFL